MGKQAVRREVWYRPEKDGFTDFPRPCYGRIPNFKDTGQVAERIRELRQFRAASCVLCAPDAVLESIKGMGIFRDEARVVTLVQELQIVEDLAPPMEEKDMRVDYILTRSKIIRTAEA